MASGAAHEGAENWWSGPFLIAGGDVLDGTGTDAIRCDVRVDGTGRVIEIGRDLAPGHDEHIVDATGLTTAPGFVDLHSHSDLYTVLRDGTGAPIGDHPKLIQGCTAQVFGQDGISAAPVHEEDRDSFAAYIAGLDGRLPAERWTWSTFGEYLSELRRHSSTRVLALAGHSTIRRYVMGMESRAPSTDELQKMQGALATAIDQGAAGFSTGLVYAPAAYATTDEVAALCEVAAAKGRPFFVHVRSESELLEEATDEVIEVAERTGVHLHYSHIKTAGKSNWAKAESLVRKIDAAIGSGVAVSADVHPYTAGSTTANVLLPPWVLDGGREKALARLPDAEVRRRVRHELMHDVTSWDNWYAFSEGWPGLVVAEASQPGLIGRSFADIIVSKGVSNLDSIEAFDVVFDLLLDEQLAVSLISFNNVEENIARFMSQPYCSIGSDGVVNPGGRPHPRLYGTFTRVLGHFVRTLGVMSLPEAVYKMTGQAAAVVGAEASLGRLAPGRSADLVLFDAATVMDEATYDDPRQPGVGVEYVWVGGRLVTQRGQSAPEVLPAAAAGS